MSDYVAVMINALFAGLGASVGNYLTSRFLFRHLDKLQKKDET
jgi:hypothetical protein